MSESTSAFLNSTPIITTIPQGVPQPTFVRASLPDEYAQIPGLVSGAPSARAIDYKFQIDQAAAIIQRHIFEVYPKRGIAQGLIDAQIEKLPKEKYQPIAAEVLNGILPFIQTLRQDTAHAVNTLSRVLVDQQFWDDGLCTSALVDSISLLLLRLLTLGTLCPGRSSLTNDVSYLKRCSGESSASPEGAMLTMWVASQFPALQDLLTQMKPIPPDKLVKLFQTLWGKVSAAIKNETAISADLDTGYVIFGFILLRSYQERSDLEANDKTIKKKILKPLDSSVMDFARQLRSERSMVLLCFEGSTTVDQLLSQALQSSLGSKTSAAPLIGEEVARYQRILRQLVDSQAALWSTFAAGPANPTLEAMAPIVRELPTVLRTLGRAIHALRRFIIAKHNAAPLPPPPQPSAEGEKPRVISKYEVAMREGFSDEELEQIMQILISVRSIRELISSSLPKFFHGLSIYISAQLQDFVRERLLTLANGSKKVAPDIERVRAMAGYFTSDDLYKRGAKSKDSKKKGEGYELRAPPHIAIIELVRAEVQHLVNAGKVSGGDARDLNAFLEASAYWVELLQADETLSHVCDQSGLFYKEVFLDVHRSTAKASIYFPVTTSLPYVLIEYTLTHRDKQDLFGALFYPLSIYDDAAAVALKQLQSRLLYDEIRVEAGICVDKIAKQIAIFVFNAVREFETERFFDQYDDDLLSTPAPGRYEPSAALRITSVLQQNQLIILGRQFDVKRAFGDHLAKLFTTEIESLLRNLERNGLVFIIAFSKSLTILRECHRVFVDANLSLVPFNDLTTQIFQTHTPNSFNSTFLAYLKKHLTKTVVPRYYLYTNPYRLIPPVHGKEGKQNVPAPLQRTLAFITVEHFRELCGLLDDGAISVLSDGICDILETVFANFVVEYGLIRDSVHRISNVGLGTGSLKTYERFEGAYRSWSDNAQVDKLFMGLRAIGNALALAEMFDIAFTLRRSSTHQVLAYLLMGKGLNDPDGKPFFQQFDANFQATQSFCQGIVTPPSPEEIAPPFLQKTIVRLIDLTSQNRDLFVGQNDSVYNFAGMTGFAAVWSVLEFIFCLKEVQSHEEGREKKEAGPPEPGPFIRFGEGVFLAGAAMLCVCRQHSLAKVLSIGSRIVQQKKTDLVASDTANLTRFLEAHALIEASFEFAVSSVLPAVLGRAPN